MQNTAYSNWGSGIGINVDQASGSPIDTTTVVPTASGLTYSVSSIPTLGLRIQLKTPAAAFTQNQPCYNIKTTTGMIPWSSFVSDCWDTTPDGGVFSPSDGISGINFQVAGATEASTWAFCVNSVSF